MSFVDRELCRAKVHLPTLAMYSIDYIDSSTSAASPLRYEQMDRHSIHMAKYYIQLVWSPVTCLLLKCMALLPLPS